MKPSKDGYKLDKAATAKQIEALLATRAIGTASKEIRPALAVTKPALTTENKAKLTVIPVVVVLVVALVAALLCHLYHRKKRRRR